MYRLEVDAESVEDVADRLEVILEYIRAGYSGGPGWTIGHDEREPHKGHDVKLADYRRAMLGPMAE